MICGLVTSKKVITTKKGDRMAFLQVEDLANNAEIIVFPKVFAKVEHHLNEHSIFVIRGTLDMISWPVCKILANEVCPIDLFFTSWPQINSVTLILPKDADLQTPAAIKEKLTTTGKTTVHIVFCEHDKEMVLKMQRKFALSFEALDELHNNYNITAKINL
jgi:DNA polymerase III alpha subunit